MSSTYSNIRESMDSGQETINARVEVNQRALIDKILARYASANAVYRELLQNSNDANATKSEIYFDVSPDGIVTQVQYRNNGMVFRPQDWTRLQKIAEGNPDPAKVGAFGVGAYSMFSICEEPMVISGSQALAFVWKGDALWSKIVSGQKETEWTTFVLPSRDPYSLPDLVEFGEFLCANLTFTQCLRDVTLYVNNEITLKISKTTIQEPQVVQTPKASSWWKSDGAMTSTSLFSLQSGNIYESRQEISVEFKGKLNKSSSKITARYVSGKAKTSIPSDLSRRMQRVTKKPPPPHVMVQVVLADSPVEAPKTDAERITASFSPQLGGRGRVFIGFRTSQTTGLAAHLQAPLIPTVEREAIDLQDATLKIYNSELLQICGIVLRLTLEHAMVQIGNDYLSNKEERDAMEKILLEQEEERRKTKTSEPKSTEKKMNEAKEEEPPTTASASILSFAKYMAKGVTKQIVNVITTAGSLLDDGSEALLNPSDPLPLSKEERQAICLMQAFCPQQSTPDSLVGTALAEGFSKCLPQYTPPVLTKLGVSREGKLPNCGLEQFVPQSGVIRKVVYKNAQEYHDVLCQCQKLTVDDLIASLKTEVLEREKAILLVQWWTKFLVREPRYTGRSIALRDAIRFFDLKDKTKVDDFHNYIYHVTNARLKEMPLPETVLPHDIQEGVRNLPRGWFVDLEIDVWASFIVKHDCMIKGQPEDEKLRLKVLSILCKEWKNKSDPMKTIFVQSLKNALKDKPCLPFDSSEPTQLAAERPGDLYLNSAELKAFAGLANSFQKVSQSVTDAGVTDDFLILLGVRKSVAVDFLFTNLDTLQWSEDPKPMIEYLRSATLTRDDISKLQSTQYLPAENDISRTFAPRELTLPSSELRLFPFVKILQWPSDDELTPKSANGKFLIKLGIKVFPALMPLLKYISEEVKDDELRLRGLEYVAKNLGSGGAYEHEYRYLRPATLTSLKIIPCFVKDIFVSASQRRELQAPVHCFSDPSCLVMGFSIVDPKFEKTGHTNRFGVPHEPDVDLVVSQLMFLVSSAKTKLSENPTPALQKVVLTAFDNIFEYMSHRSTDLPKNAMISLKKQQFIPILVDDFVQWFEPDEVYFKSSDGNSNNLTESLFHVIDFSPFLAATGVKAEASTSDLFRLMLNDAESLLVKLGGEEKYRSLLRRIAADPPFRNVSPRIRQAPFLLAYKDAESEEVGGKEELGYLLAKAEDIFLIDNSFFGRMFSVLKAPQESDLESFYEKLGSPYISSTVNKSFQVIGNASSGTSLASQLTTRLEERRPLLISPSVTSRPLVPDASKVLDQSNLKIFEVDGIKAVYSLRNSVRNQRVTCCSKILTKGKNALYVTADFDWFDVGYALGGLMLQRCQLEDAFFISSLLEAPLEQLRSRGFPVDRILSPPIPIKEPPKVLPTVEASTRAEPTAMAPVEAAKSPQSIAAPSGMDGSDGCQSDVSSSRSPQRENGIADILKQMFPDCDEDYICKRLGSNPNMDVVRSLADEMVEKGYPKQSTSKPPDIKKDDTSFLPPDLVNPEKQKKFAKRFGKALSGIRNNVGSLAPNVGTGNRGHTTTPRPLSGSNNDGRPVPPAVDSNTHSSLEQMLKDTVGNSSKVDSKGINSPETVMTQLPDGLDRRQDGCEVIPGHSLKPFNGPYRNGKTHNGVRVFSARQHQSSETFLMENFHSVDSFADLLQNLCGVFQLNLSSIAIFHDPSGGTIAFNANRALHFNVRFFFALHYSTNNGSNRDSYSYWFTTFAHELAHHLVSAHNKEHGYFTESYITLFLPKLLALLTQLESKQAGNR